MQALECLRRYPLFSLIEPFPLEGLVKAGEEMTFLTGETIFQEGTAGVSAYLVLDGCVRVLRRSPSGREISLGQLGPGELFGDYALLPPHRNTASCRASRPTRLLRLPMLPLRSVLANISDVHSNLKSWFRLHVLLAYLREQTFLGFLSAPSALKFLHRLRPMTFRALRTIQAEGLADDGWYFIESGQVVLHSGEAPSAGPLRELGPGDGFGERALLGRGGLPTAVTLSDTRCLCLTRDVFMGRAEPSQDNTLQTVQAEVSAWRKTYPWVGQEEAADCALAALAMTACFHDLNVTVHALRRGIPVGTCGASLMQLQQAAVSLGLRCAPVRVSVDQLGQVRIPAIVHFRGDHYVVLYEYGVAGVVIGDPAAGVVRLSAELFAQRCSRNVLLVGPPTRARGRSGPTR